MGDKILGINDVKYYIINILHIASMLLYYYVVGRLQSGLYLGHGNASILSQPIYHGAALSYLKGSLVKSDLYL